MGVKGGGGGSLWIMVIDLSPWIPRIGAGVVCVVMMSPGAGGGQSTPAWGTLCISAMPLFSVSIPFMIAPYWDANIASIAFSLASSFSS